MICVDCVTPAPLKKLFNAYGTEADCRYCGRHGRAIELNQLFNYVYERVVENVAGKDDLSDYELHMLYEGGADLIAVSDSREDYRAVVQASWKVGRWCSSTQYNSLVWLLGPRNRTCHGAEIQRYDTVVFSSTKAVVPQALSASKSIHQAGYPHVRDTQ